MKNIAIVTRRMITGGVEKALIAMLKQFDYTEVNIDLYLENLGGELFEEIPPNVTCYKIPSVTTSSMLKHPIAAIKKIKYLCLLKKNQYSYLEQNYYASKMLLPITKKYDIAIAYHAPNTVPIFYVINQISAYNKYLWLHGDLDTNHGNEKIALKYHGMYDRVYCVSKSIKENFLYYHPDMEGKVDVFYNYIDLEEILEKSVVGKTFEDNFSGMRLLTIGRLSKQKGYDFAIQVCKKLVDKGYHFRWYICGDGDEKETLRSMISLYGLEDIFVLLGNQENPYRFLKNCDLYVQTSRFEGYCTTTNEARMLCKPVITTDVSGAREQFINEKTGWIVPFAIDDLVERIEYCFNNLSHMDLVCKELQKMKFQNKEEIKRLY